MLVTFNCNPPRSGDTPTGPNSMHCTCWQRCSEKPLQEVLSSANNTEDVSGSGQYCHPRKLPVEISNCVLYTLLISTGSSPWYLYVELPCCGRYFFCCCRIVAAARAVAQNDSGNPPRVICGYEGGIPCLSVRTLALDLQNTPKIDRFCLFLLVLIHPLLVLVQRVLY